MKRMHLQIVLAVAISLIGCTAFAQNAIKFFSWYGTEALTFDDTFLQVVKKAMPKTKVEVVPVVWDQMHAQLQALIAGNAMPDLLDFKGQDIARYAPNGNLLDLTGQAFLNKVPASARENLKVNGKEYGVPYSALFQGVMYNRTVFKKYNLKVPATYAELMEVTRVLKAKGVTPFATHFRDNWNIGNITMQFAMSEVFNDTPAWGDDLRAGKTSFEKSAGYREVFTHVKDLYDNTWKDTFSVDMNEACRRFVAGEAAMYPTGTWTNTNLSMDPSFDWGVFPFPGKKAGAKLIFEPNHTWAISAKTKDPKTAMKILETVLASKELAKHLVDEANTYSLLSGIVATKNYPVNADIEAYKTKNQIVNVSIGNNQIPWAYQEEYSRYIAEWLLGTKTLDQALQAATLYKDKLK